MNARTCSPDLPQIGRQSGKDTDGEPKLIIKLLALLAKRQYTPVDYFCTIVSTHVSTQ